MMGLLNRSCNSIQLSSIFKAQLRTLQIKTKPLNMRLHSRNGVMVYASQKSAKKIRDRQSERIMKPNKDTPDEPTNVTESERKEDSAQVKAGNEDGGSGLNTIPSRGDVLRACTVTSSLIAALGLTIRQVSHITSVEGLPVFDCSVQPSFTFEIWHLKVIAGLVVVVSSCRYLLLNVWPEFEESSQTANHQILTSLEPLDYILVAFLPGFSEELLFRGGLLPLFGFNTLSALGVGALFGILHLGSGRKYSFAIWATFVGFVYGYATIASSSIIVPMAAHGLNNLVGGLLWRFSKTSPSK